MKELVYYAGKSKSRIEITSSDTYSIKSRIGGKTMLDISTSKPLCETIPVSCTESIEEFLTLVSSRTMLANPRKSDGETKQLNYNFNYLVTFHEDIGDILGLDDRERVLFLKRLVDKVLSSQRGDFPDYGWGKHPMYPKNHNCVFSLLEHCMNYRDTFKSFPQFDLPIVVGQIPSSFHTEMLSSVFEVKNIFHESPDHKLPSYSHQADRLSECVYFGSPLEQTAGGGDVMGRFYSKVEFIKKKALVYKFFFIPITLSYCHLEEQYNHLCSEFPHLSFKPYVHHRLDIFISNIYFEGVDFPRLLTYANFSPQNLMMCLVPNAICSILRNHAAYKGELFHFSSLRDYNIPEHHRSKLNRFIDWVGFQNAIVVPTKGIVKNHLDTVKAIEPLETVFFSMIQSSKLKPTAENIVPSDDGLFFRVSYFGMKRSASFQYHIMNILEIGLFEEFREGGKIFYALTELGYSVYTGDQEIPADYLKIFETRSMSNDPSVYLKTKIPCQLNCHLVDKPFLECLCSRCQLCLDLIGILSDNGQVDPFNYDFLPSPVHSLLRRYNRGSLSGSEAAVLLRNFLLDYSRYFSYVPPNFDMVEVTSIPEDQFDHLFRTMKNKRLSCFLLNTIVRFDPILQEYQLRL
jgi:hypothetical protein